jgi:hypothetical protein
MAACRPQNRSNRENQKNLGILPKGILTPSFIEIAPAVMKRALLTDDDDLRIIQKDYGDLPGPRFPILAKVRITGPQPVIHIMLNDQMQKMKKGGNEKILFDMN